MFEEECKYILDAVCIRDISFIKLVEAERNGLRVSTTRDSIPPQATMKGRAWEVFYTKGGLRILRIRTTDCERRKAEPSNAAVSYTNRERIYQSN